MCAVVAHILHFSLHEIEDLDFDELEAWFQEALWVRENLMYRL